MLRTVSVLLWLLLLANCSQLTSCSSGSGLANIRLPAVDDNGEFVIPAELTDEYDAVSAELAQGEFPELDEMSEEYRRAYSYFAFGTYSNVIYDQIWISTLESAEGQQLDMIESAAAETGGHVSSNYYLDSIGVGDYFIEFAGAQSRQRLMGVAELLYTRLGDRTVLVQPGTYDILLSVQ